MPTGAWAACGRGTDLPGDSHAERSGPTRASTTICINLDAIFVSLELSRSTWLVTSLSPGGGGGMSRHSVPGGDAAALLARLADLQEGACADGAALPRRHPEAGLDGFWIHRALRKEGVESHVVDPASIAVQRRRRRAKTDRIDGEALVRALLAYKRGEPRVCAMVRVPAPEEEDRRRLCRELKSLIGERIRHANRLKGLFFAQGITGYEPRPPRQARAAGGTLYRRRAVRAGAPEGAGAARDRSSGAADPPDRHSQSGRNALLAAERAMADARTG